MIMEKAWAKICGSYEAMEMGTPQEAFNNIDGTPCQEFLLGELEKQGRQAELWEMLQEADRHRFPVTAGVDSTTRCRTEIIKDFGLCDFHSYTMMQAKACPLFRGSHEYRYFLELRNPWGNKEWLGQWSDSSNTWDKYPYVDEQLRQATEDRSQTSKKSKSKSVSGTGEEKDWNDGAFWILFKDFFTFFYRVTINYTHDDFSLVRISD